MGRSKGLFWLSGLTLLAALIVMYYFFTQNVPGEIKTEIQDTIKELSSPNNPAYTKYSNQEWGINFEHPTFMQVASGPTSDNTRFAVILYPSRDERTTGPNLEYAETDMMGFHLSRKATFEEEVERVGGSRRDLRQDFEFNGFRAVKIKEHVNRVNGATETAIVVDHQDFITSFFLNYKEDEDLRSYFDRMVNTYTIDDN